MCKGKEIMKKMFFEPKKPKNIKEFWDIFVKNIKILYENQEELENKPSREKWAAWISVCIAIAMIFVTGYNVYLHQIEVDFATSEDLISDVIGTEYAKRMGDDELYTLTLHNYGSVENELQVTITFNLNVTILDYYNIDEETLKVNETTRRQNSEYYVLYQKIRAGEEIIIRLDIENEDFKVNNSLLLYPKYIEAYTIEGKILVFRNIEKT